MDNEVQASLFIQQMIEAAIAITDMKAELVSYPLSANRCLGDCKQQNQRTAKATQTNKVVVNDLMRLIALIHFSSGQTISNNGDNSTDNVPVIDKRNPVRQWKIRLNFLDVCTKKPNKIPQTRPS